MSSLSCSPTVFNSMCTVILDPDFFNNTVESEPSWVHIDMSHVSSQEEDNILLDVKPDIGRWVYETTLYFTIPDSYNTVLRIFKNDMFPGHIMLIGKIQNFNLVMHCDYRLVQDGRLDIRGFSCFTDHNTYYRVHIELYTTHNPFRENTMKEHLKHLVKGNIKFTLCNTYSQARDFDCFLNIEFNLSDISTYLPKPLTFEVQRDKDTGFINVKLRLIPTHPNMEDVICIVHFVATPLFQTLSTDDEHVLLSPKFRAYHKFHRDIFPVKVDRSHTLVSRMYQNKFTNIPLSIIATIHDPKDIEGRNIETDDDYYHIISRCKPMRQYFPHCPNLIPRYIFMDQMPAVKLEVFEITSCEYIFKITKDTKLKIPFQCNLWVTDVISGKYWGMSFDENTEIIVFRVPYICIQPEQIKKRLSIQYDVKFQNCAQINKDHFIIIPIDNMVGGRSEIIVDMQRFISGRSNSYEKHLFILCDECMKDKKHRHDRCEHCYRYRSTFCATCGNRICISTLSPSSISIEEIQQDEGTRFLFRHRKCPEVKNHANIPSSPFSPYMRIRYFTHQKEDGAQNSYYHAKFEEFREHKEQKE